MSFRSIPLFQKSAKVGLITAILTLVIGLTLFAAVIAKRPPTLWSAHGFASPQVSTVTIGDSTTSTPVPKEVVQIGIYPEGFSPTALEQKSGEFLLSINDRTGLPETNLILKRVAGDQLRQVRIPDSAAHWADVIDLPPGSYLLTETSHPEWQCAIAITAR